MNKRDNKKFKRENRESKKTSWFCAGCKVRHPKGQVCTTPRLFAPNFTRVTKN